MSARISLTLPDLERDHIQRSADAPIKLLEYGDYECPFCAETHALVKEIQRQLGDDLLFAFRNFPLTNIHPHAEHAAEAAEAAGDQGNFWGMHDLLSKIRRRLRMKTSRHMQTSSVSMRSVCSAKLLQAFMRPAFAKTLKRGLEAA